jgi:uncharacterized protein
MIEQAGPELFMVSTDLPHLEGGRGPLAKFMGELNGVFDDARRRFFAGNIAIMMNGEAAAV